MKASQNSNEFTASKIDSYHIFEIPMFFDKKVELAE